MSAMDGANSSSSRSNKTGSDNPLLIDTYQLIGIKKRTKNKGSPPLIPVASKAFAEKKKLDSTEVKKVQASTTPTGKAVSHDQFSSIVISTKSFEHPDSDKVNAFARELSPLFDQFQQVGQKTFDPLLSNFISSIPRHKVASIISELISLFEAHKNDPDPKVYRFCFRMISAMVRQMGFEAESPLLGQSEKLQKFSILVQNHADLGKQYPKAVRRFSRAMRKGISEEFRALESFHLPTISARLKNLHFGLSNAVKKSSFLQPLSSSALVHRNRFGGIKEINPKELEEPKLKRLLDDLNKQGEAYKAAEVLLLVKEDKKNPVLPELAKHWAHHLITKSGQLLDKGNQKESFRHYEIAKELLIAYEIGLDSPLPTGEKTFRQLLAQMKLTFTGKSEQKQEIDPTAMNSQKFSNYLQTLIKDENYLTAANAIIMRKSITHDKEKLASQAQLVANLLLDESGKLFGENKLQASSHLNMAKELLEALGDKGIKEFATKTGKGTVKMPLEKKIATMEAAFTKWIDREINTHQQNAFVSLKTDTSPPTAIFIGNLVDAQKDIPSLQKDSSLDTRIENLIGSYLEKDSDLTQLKQWVKDQDWSQSIEKAKNNHIALFHFLNMVAERKPALIPALQEIIGITKVTPEKILVADLVSGWHPTQIEKMASLYETWNEISSYSPNKRIVNELDHVRSKLSSADKETMTDIVKKYYCTKGGVDVEKLRTLLSMYDHLPPEHKIASFAVIFHLVNDFKANSNAVFSSKGPFFGVLGDLKNYVEKAVANGHIQGAFPSQVKELQTAVKNELKVPILNFKETISAISSDRSSGDALALNWTIAIPQGRDDEFMRELIGGIDNKTSLTTMGNIVHFFLSLDEYANISSSPNNHFKDLQNKLKNTPFDWKQGTRTQTLIALTNKIEECIKKASSPTAATPPVVAPNPSLQGYFDKLMKGEPLSEDEQKTVVSGLVEGIRKEYEYHLSKIKTHELSSPKATSPHYAALDHFTEEVLPSFVTNLLLDIPIKDKKNSDAILSQNLLFCMDLAEALLQDSNFPALKATMAILAQYEDLIPEKDKAWFNDMKELVSTDPSAGDSGSLTQEMSTHRKEAASPIIPDYRFYREQIAHLTENVAKDSQGIPSNLLLSPATGGELTQIFMTLHKDLLAIPPSPSTFSSDHIYPSYFS